MEALVGPMKLGNAALEADYRALLAGTSDISMIPIDLDVLDRAAAIRATSSVKTPDAIHAATAMIVGCALFITNDASFRGIAGLPVRVLRNLLTP